MMTLDERRRILLNKPTIIGKLREDSSDTNELLLSEVTDTGITSINIFGNSIQNSTMSGKNLVDYRKYNMQYGTVEVTINERSDLVALSFPEGSTPNVYWNVENSKIGETYTASFILGSYSHSNNLAILMRSEKIFQKSDGTQYKKTKDTPINGSSVTTVITLTDTVTPNDTSDTLISHKIMIFKATSQYTVSLQVGRLQVEKGSKFTSYEDYIGGTPSPNYLFPESIYSSNDSLNLFNPDTLILDGSCEKVDNGYKFVGYPVEYGSATALVKHLNSIMIPGKTYTFHRDIITRDTTTSSGNISFVDTNDATVMSSSYSSTTGIITFALPRDTTIKKVVIYGQQTGKAEVILDNFQILEGTHTEDTLPKSHRIEIAGKNLFNITREWDVSGTYCGWLVNPDSRVLTITLIDKDPAIDLGELYVGFTKNGKDASEGLDGWLIAKGELNEGGSNGLTGTGNVYTRTIKADFKYLSLYKYGNKTATGELTQDAFLRRFDVQIEYGAESTEYVPYFPPKQITIPSSITLDSGEKLTMRFGRVGDIVDYLEVKDGKVRYYENIRHAIATEKSTMNTVKYVNNGKPYDTVYISVLDGAKKLSPGFCSISSDIGADGYAYGRVWMGKAGKNIFHVGLLNLLGRSMDEPMTLAEFKTWIATHPIQYVFPLNPENRRVHDLPADSDFVKELLSIKIPHSLSATIGVYTDKNISKITSEYYSYDLKEV